MSFFFGLLDVLLTSIMLFDTLGLAYQFRKEGTCDKNDYLRICLSWILFLTICNLFSCNRKGFLGVVFRLIIFAAKAFVTIPVIGGTLKIHKYLIEDGNAEKCYKKVKDIVKSKLCNGCQCPSSNVSQSQNDINQETPN